ncbi:MAG: T9SS type A sorting domain-containing protein [Ignavibacteria bacterium]|jgi:hypothetical protein|nr:T9SS type A sorting domain-containing protein [Ignavibacteria bacterium]
MFKNYFKLIVLLVFLTVNLSVFADPGKTWQTAELIVSGETKNGSFTQEVGDELWYKIEVPVDGEVVFIVNSEKSLKLDHINIHSIGKDGNISQRAGELFSNKPANNEIFRVGNLSNGPYYVKLKKWEGYGGYSLNYVFNKNTFTNDIEPNNNHDEVKQTLVKGQTIQGHLGYYYNYVDADNEDWYKVEVPEDGEAIFTVKAEEGLILHWLELYDGNLTEIASKLLENKQEVLKVLNLSKGTYYIKLKRWSGAGGYTLAYGLINSIDSPEDTYVSVYPNPSQDIFYVQILDKYQYDYLQVLSVDGKLLFRQNCLNSDDNIKIDLTNYPSGIYLINFIGRNTSDFIKLVKE